MTTTPSPTTLQAKLMNAVATGDHHQISRALRALPPPTRDDVWATQALECAIKRNDQDPEIQVKIVGDLLACRVPLMDNIATDGEAFRQGELLHQVLCHDALHLWDPLVKAGFVGNGHALLDFILGKFHPIPLSAERKGQWLEKLLQCPFAPDPLVASESSNDTWPSAAMERVLNFGNYELLPMLHRAGYTLPNTSQNIIVIASSVALGRWPFPDLVSPNFMMQEDGSKTFFNRLPSSFSDREFLFDPDHIQRFCQLPLADRELVGEMITAAAAESNWASTFMGPPSSDTLKCLMLLYDHQLLNLDELLANPSLSVSTSHLVEAARPEVVARHLNKATTPSLQSRQGSRRL